MLNLGARALNSELLSHVNRHLLYRGADTSLARPGRKQSWKHNRDARDFNNIETRDVIKILFFLQGNAPKEIHEILREILACLLPGRVRVFSAPLYRIVDKYQIRNIVNRCT